MYCTISEMRRLEVERGVGLAEALVGKTTDLRHLVCPDSIALHDPASRIGALGGEFPVAVGGGRSVRLGIGVAFSRELVGEVAELLCECDKHLAAIAVQLGAAAIKEGVVS